MNFVKENIQFILMFDLMGPTIQQISDLPISKINAESYSEMVAHLMAMY